MGENQVQQGLYSQSFEHDNCGIGAVVNIKGRKDHQIVADALKIVEQLEQEEVFLETAVSLYKEGLSLAALCREKLSAAEGEIVLLRKEAGLWQEEPFQAEVEE